MGVGPGVLVASEREVARPHLHAGAVHGLDEPAAREGHDPLRLGVLVLLADPARGEDQDDHAGGRGAQSLYPGRRGALRYACKREIGEPAPGLAAHAVLVGPDVPVGHAGLHGRILVLHHDASPGGVWPGPGCAAGVGLPGFTLAGRWA